MIGTQCDLTRLHPAMGVCVELGPPAYAVGSGSAQSVVSALASPVLHTRGPAAALAGGILMPPLSPWQVADTMHA